MKYIVYLLLFQSLLRMRNRRVPTAAQQHLRDAGGRHRGLHPGLRQRLQVQRVGQPDLQGRSDLAAPRPPDGAPSHGGWGRGAGCARRCTGHSWYGFGRFFVGTNFEFGFYIARFVGRKNINKPRIFVSNLSSEPIFTYHVVDLKISFD